MNSKAQAALSRLVKWTALFTMTSLLIVTAAGCLERHEAQYSQLSRKREETNGVMHLAQDQVNVVIQGDKTVRIFDVPNSEKKKVEKVTEKTVGGRAAYEVKTVAATNYALI